MEQRVLETEPHCEVDTNGTEHWLMNGRHHRLDGPAYILKSGTKIWSQFGIMHRIDGPAVITADGREIWYYHGTELKVKTLKEFQSYINNKAFW